VIFTTVLVDLIGFGIVIPLINLYGEHLGATGWELALLGGIYSFMQFLFAPLWGALSDRIGRRPVLLISLAGSTLSYLAFGLADSKWLLIGSRAMAGICAANISAAQAYIADITPPEKRAQGMGMIGAAFGLGFTLGPPLGGIAAKYLGLSAPGFIAAAICGANLILAYWRLPESLPVERRQRGRPVSYSPINAHGMRQVFQSPILILLVPTFFLITFAFSNFEQTFTLLIQDRFGHDTAEAGFRGGMALLWLGIVGVIVQGGLIRRLVPRYGERRLMLVGASLFSGTMLVFPFIPEYWMYFPVGVLMACGLGILNPSLTGLISKNASEYNQGAVLGFNQGMGSLARTIGPIVALMTFQYHPALPYIIGGLVAGGCLLLLQRVPIK